MDFIIGMIKNPVFLLLSSLLVYFIIKAAWFKWADRNYDKQLGDSETFNKVRDYDGDV